MQIVVGGCGGNCSFLRDSLELIENKCRNSKNGNIVEDRQYPIYYPKKLICLFLFL